jgi:hypothetical protein
MPSSTSNSEASVRLTHPANLTLDGRLIPMHGWGRLTGITVVVFFLLLLGWEILLRGMGYGPSYNDTPGLWALWRNKVAGSDQVVLMGSSRIRFNLSHEPVSKAFGGTEVINLSMNGSVARPVLHDLAKDETFSGTVICDYTPNLFWAPGGPNMDTTMEFVNYRPAESPIQWMEQRVLLVPDSLLTFIQTDDMTLKPLLGRLFPLPNRQGARLKPRLPFYFQKIEFSRREKMWDVFERSPEMQEDMKSIWSGLMAFMKPLPPPLVEQLLAGVVEDVKAIEARGGRVIFVCFPSTGAYLEHEQATVPRATHWDLLIHRTGTLGIHYEDYPELSGFDCPEWSHLTASDAEKFSEALVAILVEELDSANKQPKE